VSGFCVHNYYKTSQLNTGISSGQHKAEQTCWAAEQHERVVR